MGLGGYLAAKNDAEHYSSELRREEMEVLERTADEESEVREILESYGLPGSHCDPVIAHFKANPKQWVDWMMRFELGLEPPDPTRAVKSAATIAFSYIAGGLVPLMPYILINDAKQALLYSVVATLIALFGFGYMKGTFTGTHPWQSAFRTMLIGGIAAGAAFGIAKAIG